MPVLALLPALLLGGRAARAEQTSLACDAPGVTSAMPRLEMVVSPIHKLTGDITFTLYGDDPKRFLAHHGKIGLIRVPVTGPSATGCFAVSAPGTYAVAVYDDANGNHRFDLTLVGLPAEAWGFSNNPSLLLALPGFRQVAFTVAPGVNRIAIRLHY
ncbi:hypothetical protein Acid7E03_40750 [Acidisoma sp. 7E03]